MTDEDICGVEVSRCQCMREPGHEPPHRCDCGGAWTGEGYTFQVVAFPPDPVVAELGLPPVVGALLAGGVRRGGIRWPLPGDVL